jgi:hypothetical protein
MINYESRTNPKTAILLHLKGKRTKMSTLEREGSASAGFIGGVQLAAVDQSLVVTVTVTPGDPGYLKLIAWQISADPQTTISGTQYIVRKGEASTGQVTDMGRVVSIGNHRIVTALGDNHSKLKLIAWQLSASGQIERRGEAAAGYYKDVAIAILDTTRFVTFLNYLDKYKLIVWNVSSDGSIIQREGEVEMVGTCSRLRVVATGPLSNGHSVVTPLRDANGNLKLIAWWISADGQQVSRKGDASAGTISEVAANWMKNVVDPVKPGIDAAVVITAVRDGNGDLKMIRWHISRDGQQQISRHGDATAGAIHSAIAVTSLGTSFEANHLVTAVRTADGYLKLIAWDVSGYDQVKRDAAVSAGDISAIAVDRVWTNHLVTAVCTGDSKLKLIGWRYSTP